VQNADVIVVGGGPAGSACATALTRAGRDVLVLDRARFPRVKLCAGWVTPGVFDALGLDPRAYPAGLHVLDRLMIHAFGVTVPFRTRQYSVRRVEFDDFLLRRSGARVIHHTVRDIATQGGHYVVDGAFRAPHIVGAGGTRCPVQRLLFRDRHARDPALQVAATELEFEYPWRDPRCHLWFFDHGLPGYAWYVPKADGWLNLGIGAMAEPLRRRRQNLHEHWERLLARLRRQGMLDERTLQPAGYSYFLRERRGPYRNGNAWLAGDAAGMATRDLGEGIGPAIRNGAAIAAGIVHGAPVNLDDISVLSVDELLAGAWRSAGRALLRLIGVLPRQLAPTV
jgi:flavin-dependent dehydrogenase